MAIAMPLSHFPDSYPILLFTLALSVAYLYARKWHAPASGLPLPPGPRRLPIVGNLFDMPTKNMAPTLHEMSRKHGE